MRTSPFDAFTCPLDGAPLHVSAEGAVCPAGHRFDRAREGYLNLLPVQRKASRDPGDDKAMVDARRRFLAAGHYAPIVDAVFAMVRGRVDAMAARALVPEVRVLDAGCGEGDCLSRVDAAARADALDASLLLAGIDISKWAVRAAARRSPGIAWAVASNRGLPFAANSFDVVLSLFGFPVWGEFARVLVEGGEVIVVDPAPDHLRELRELIYEEVRPSPPPVHPGAAEAGFVCVASQPVRFIAEVEGDGQVAALLRMTPHAHRTSAERREVVDAMPRLAVTVDVLLRRYVASAASD
jgi:23S rRNA (guanine745-N1)-methyltransferase